MGMITLALVMDLPGSQTLSIRFLDVNPPVPERGSLALIGLGLAAPGVARRIAKRPAGATAG